MIEIGRYNVLKAKRITANGIYLTDDSGNEVLLPNSSVPEETKLNDFLDVFIYTDSEDRLISTTLTPKITLNEYALLKVLSVTEYGAFADWGLSKDLLIPFSEQPVRMVKGESHIIYLYLDEKSDRLVGSAYVEKFLDNALVSFEPGNEVDIMVYKQSELGYKVIINNKYEGLLYENEIFQHLKPGHQCKGYIKKVREDNNIDVCLQRFGYRNIASNSEKILDYLKQSGGYLGLNDKSKPEEIMDKLEMSKKTYKKAIGDLYKQRLIQIDTEGIRLL
jgi:predicted RNA-binding protein (virulence factor B family)